MAIQVTGLFKNPTTNLIHESPLIQINAKLTYKGSLQIEGMVCFPGEICRDTIVFRDLDRKILNSDPSIIDPYDNLIQSIETFLMLELKSSNPINSQSIFSRV